MAIFDAVLRPTMTTVRPGTITQSDTAGTTPGDDDKAPSFVTRETRPGHEGRWARRPGRSDCAAS